MLAVDQGVAAILGAGVGVVGTLGTAVLTYLAARQQNRDQGSIEHDRWLRDQRQAAYAGLLAGYEELSACALRLEEALAARADKERLDSLVAELAAKTTTFDHARVRISVAGPKSASTAAGQVNVGFRRVHAALLKLRECQDARTPTAEAKAELAAARAQVPYAYRDFTREARRVLETPPLRATGRRTLPGDPPASGNSDQAP